MLQERLPSAVRPPGHGWTYECPVPASGHGRGGTPGPIPNPEVKPPSADGTAERVRGRAGRRWPAEGIRAREGGERIRAPLPLLLREHESYSQSMVHFPVCIAQLLLYSSGDKRVSAAFSACYFLCVARNNRYMQADRYPSRCWSHGSHEWAAS